LHPGYGAVHHPGLVPPDTGGNFSRTGTILLSVRRAGARSFPIAGRPA
jgi:hypothetical protein